MKKYSVATMAVCNICGAFIHLPFWGLHQKWHKKGRK